MKTKTNTKPAITGGTPVRQEFLPYCKPFIGKEEISAVSKVIKSGWLTTGPKNKEFEEEAAKYLGINPKCAVLVNSYTSALHLALVCSGIKQGDEVITSPYTFASTANVIVHCGARPVFVDVEKDTLNINPELIEEKITDKTRAIIAVHFAGHSCDMDAITKIARKHDLIVIEDAAHAFGTKYKGLQCGTLSQFGCYSFYATKNLTMGEGGMIICPTPDVAERVRMLKLHGISKDAYKRYEQSGSWYYEVEECGFKYNLPDIQATIGLEQLKKYPLILQKRKEIAKLYKDAFFDVQEITCMPEKNYCSHIWHLFTIRLDFSKLNINRDAFIEALNKEKIGTSVHFIPLTLHRFYQQEFKYTSKDCPVAAEEYSKLISLPLYPSMKKKDVRDVINAVKKLINHYRR